MNADFRKTSLTRRALSYMDSSEFRSILTIHGPQGESGWLESAVEIGTYTGTQFFSISEPAPYGDFTVAQTFQFNEPFELYVTLGENWGSAENSSFTNYIRFAPFAVYTGDGRLFPHPAWSGSEEFVFRAAPVPEPATLSTVGTALILLMMKWCRAFSASAKKGPLPSLGTATVTLSSPRARRHYARAEGQTTCSAEGAPEAYSCNSIVRRAPIAPA
jgi:hypothetical protein